MKKKIFMACAALVVSAAAVVGVKAYSSSTYSLLDANLEAIANDESSNTEYKICVNPNKYNSERPDMHPSDIIIYIRPLCEEGTSLMNPEPINPTNPTGATYPCKHTVYGDQWSFFGYCYN